VDLQAQVAAIIGNTLHYRTTDGAFEMDLIAGRVEARTVKAE